MMRLLSFMLALLIAVTSQQMAVARAVTTDAAGQFILCTGQGVVTVTLDANGGPVAPAHICPDCALNILDVAADFTASGSSVVHMQILAQTPVTASQYPVIPTSSNARAPPRTV